MNRSPIKMYIRDFVICYIILFFTSFAVEVNFKFSNLPTYIMPAIASLVAVLFFTRNAVWPVYKKGDKVWWSTYGEDHSAEHKPTSQKLILRFVSAYCFIFTVNILHKNAPIYLSVKDYIVPALFGIGVLILPLISHRSEKASESAS